jgi:hypothetical protein
MEKSSNVRNGGWRMPAKKTSVQVVGMENAGKELAGTSDPVGKCRYGKWQYIAISVLFIKTFRHKPTMCRIN